MKKIHNRSKVEASIPPPPDLDAGYDAIIDYHKRHSVDELERAGHVEEVPPAELRPVRAAAMYQLLCMDDLRVKLAHRDYKLLAELAASKDSDVESIIKQCIKEFLRQESGVSRNGKT